MALLTKPIVHFPEYKVTQDEMLEALHDLFPDYPKWEVADKMIRNSEVDQRYLSLPLHEVIKKDRQWGEKNEIYRQMAIKMIVKVTNHVLDINHMKPKDIDMIILTSSTGFLMPSLIAYLMNELDFRNNTIQIPVAQMGCAAASWAINRSFDYIKANPSHNVLFISAELSSMVFQPSDYDISNLISDTLFGDCVAASVIKGHPKSGDFGFQLDAIGSYFKKNSIDYIKYDVKNTGFHFHLSKDVMNVVEELAPHINALIFKEYGIYAKDLNFFLFHSGGRKILDSLEKCLELPENSLRHCRSSLRHHGNSISSVILDIFDGKISSQSLQSGQKGMLLAMGPGFTAEFSCGHWLVF
ncbi:MAG: type III polyketide synthase [Alphaproteobacteria bacterium]|nr:type III polyketide synthase [Alphaproteobacteria bacterium]